MATISVSTFQELQTAVGNSKPGDEIVLQNNITASGDPWRISKRSFTIDLNRNVLELQCAFLIMESSNVTIKNGTINGEWRNTANIQSSTLRLENVSCDGTIQLYQAVYGGKIYLVDCSLSSETLTDCIATAVGQGSAVYVEGGTYIAQVDACPIFIAENEATLDISGSKDDNCRLFDNKQSTTSTRAVVEANTGGSIIIHSNVDIVGGVQPCVALFGGTLVVEGGQMTSTSQPAINLAGSGSKNSVEFKPNGSTDYVDDQNVIYVASSPAIASESPAKDSIVVYGGTFRSSGNTIFTPSDGFDNVSLVRLNYLGEVNPDWIAEGSAIIAEGKIRAAGDPDQPEPPGPGPDPEPDPDPEPETYEVITMKKTKVFISPNIKAYSNLFGGVLYVSDKTFTSFDEELKLVKYKLPGSGEWATGYVKSEDLES